MRAFVLAVLLSTGTAVYGMDRWAALSQIESGDNDRAVGHDGEVSRYQIKPSLWNAGEPSDCNAALENARHIMQTRTTEFQKRFGREATDFEFYVLWNAPGQIEKPSRVVRARAERFANLCTVQEPQTGSPASVTVPTPQPVASQPVTPRPVLMMALRAN